MFASELGQRPTDHHLWWAYLNYALKNSRSEEKAQISGNLRQLCEEFYVQMRQTGDTWDKAVVEYFRKGGSWSFEVIFDRGEAVKQRHTAASDLTNTAKPSWKFWQ